MSTTFGSAVRVFLKTLSEKHIPQVFLVEGLSISLADIQNPDYVISRDQYLALSERFAQLLAEYKDNSIDLAQYMDAGHWEALLGSLPLSVSVADLDGTLVFANRSISGRSREEVIGRTVYDFTPLEDHPVIREAVQTLAETGESCRIETLSGLPDGRIICLETYLSPIFGDNIVIGFLSVTSDITERKRSEAELHKRALQLQIVAEVSAQIKSTLNLHQLIQNICDLTKQHFGLYHAHIYLLDVGSGNLVIEAGAG
ncbi:MAG TPA: PAS domain S-box protein, partial [Aggregatilineales bacterium]|nr:PAS domain S-box protein [Aggregatilineales bacterium]